MLYELHLERPLVPQGRVPRPEPLVVGEGELADREQVDVVVSDPADRAVAERADRAAEVGGAAEQSRHVQDRVSLEPRPAVVGRYWRVHAQTNRLCNEGGGRSGMDGFVR